MTYNRFIQGLGLAGVEVDRKILADLAVNDIAAFNALVEVAKAAGDRVLHVHLKDVDAAKAQRVRNGEVAFREAVLDGLFVPLGEGGVDIAGVISTLEDQGYRGWYVLEQDVSLKSDPPDGEGPKADAIDSVAFLRDLVGEPA